MITKKKVKQISQNKLAKVKFSLRSMNERMNSLTKIRCIIINFFNQLDMSNSDR